ncbi:MAG: 2-amino-4-hydroxy-6-hydroxymethyldihydropteridine diphosphokinase [Chitinispirillaceae bacterium]|nr:2-amino-4-hydroxy-6-hydroxymethyldihydropteridine diphosphokinase [Chitinispirillaceae bacterium]
MVNVAICIGSNSGDRRWYINRMEEMLKEVLFPPVIMSALMETEPVGVFDEQPWYLNRVIGGCYDRSAFKLLSACAAIERSLGRTEKGMVRARTADIDILLFGNETIAAEELTIPHPAILLRRFCLEGLSQIMPDAVIGTAAGTVGQQYAAMTQQIRSQGLLFPGSEGGHSDN